MKDIIIQKLKLMEEELLYLRRINKYAEQMVGKQKLQDWYATDYSEKVPEKFRGG